MTSVRLITKVEVNQINSLPVESLEAESQQYVTFLKREYMESVLVISWDS